MEMYRERDTNRQDWPDVYYRNDTSSQRNRNPFRHRITRRDDGRGFTSLFMFRDQYVSRTRRQTRGGGGGGDSGWPLNGAPGKITPEIITARLLRETDARNVER